MGKFLLLVIVVLIVLMVGAVLAYQYAGIWGLLGVIAGVVVLAKLVPKLIGALIFRSLKRAINASGEALRGATIEVHSIEPADEPPPEDDEFDDEFDDDYDDKDLEDDDEDDSELMDPAFADLFYDGPRHWYYIDLTVQPAIPRDGQPTEYQPWSPHMLMLLGPSREVPKELGPMAAFANMADGVCEVRSVEMWQDGEWDTDEFDEEDGPQRIRLLAGVKPGETKLRVGYVSEILGDVNLPAM